jgi:hypothetical protein
MYFCKSRNHVWSKKEDAEKCCNGYVRIPVFGKEIPADAKNVQVDEKTGVRYAKVWVKVNEESESFSQSA